ncbi:MAG: GNAT family N-acetyltransferase [Burkholderiaceae bacterium]|nr:GNAT family N-acetyltransferase [Burkholderiaceae bacterium]
MPASEASLEVQIREATYDDPLCLSVLAMQVFLDTYATQGIRPAIAREVLSGYSEAVFRGAVTDEMARIHVAEVSGHLVGFAHVTLGAQHELSPPGNQSELLRLYVQEPFVGQGIGTMLLAQAEAAAAQGGSTVLWLTPWVHNHRALQFYKRRGYEDYGLTQFVFEGESHDNRLYAKHIAAAPSAA